MRRRGPMGARAAGAAVGALLAACSSAPSSSPPPQTPLVTPVAIRAEMAVRFESDNPWLTPGVMDIYAPARSGTWPVAVLFHGTPDMLSRSSLSDHATRLADAGFVVFVPNWAKYPGEYPSAAGELLLDQGEIAQAACAVAFAQAHAAEYGGDAAQTVTFGYSAGGIPAAVTAFAQPTPSTDCLTGSGLGAIGGLVLWDADVLLGEPFFDPVLADEPAVFDTFAPWAHLANNPDLRVAFAVSEDPMNGRQDGPWLDVRSPDGEFRRLAEVVGALDDGYIGLDEMQTMFAQALRERGFDVYYEVMPGSTHYNPGDEGWGVFIEAFRNAAGLD